MAACKDHAPAGETKCTPDGCPPSCRGHDCYVCLDRAPVYQGAEPQPDDPCGQCHERCRPDCPPGCDFCLPPRATPGVRWGEAVPQRDWRRWGFAYAAHFATGVISGAGVGAAVAGAPGLTALSATISGLVMTRQTVEWLRRNDTPGRDMGDHIAGYLVGFLGGIAAARVVLGVV